MSEKRHPSTMRRTVHYFWAVTRTSMPAFLGALASTIGYVGFLTYANSYYMAAIVDAVSAGGATLQSLTPFVVALIVVNVLGQACSKLQDYTCWKLENQATYKLDTHCFDTLSNQSMTFHSNRYGGSLVSQTSKFVSAYSNLTDTMVYSVVPTLASVVLTIVMLAAAVPLYVIVLSVFLVAYAVVTYRLYKRILPINAQASAAQNRLSGELSDSVTNILTVKTYGREAYERQVFDEANREARAADARGMLQSTITGTITSSMIVVIMALAIVFIAGGNAWFGISAGMLVMMFNYTYKIGRASCRERV